MDYNSYADRAKARREQLRLAKKKKIVFVCTIVILSLVFFSTAFAQEIHDMFVSASVNPHYEIKKVHNNLMVETNMNPYVNGKRVSY